MTEKTKKRIKDAFTTLLKAIADKETELLDIRTTEEGMPETQKEALEEILQGSPEHAASETTNARLVKLIELRDGVDSYQGQVLSERDSISTDQENVYLNDVEEYCKTKINEVTKI